MSWLWQKREAVLDFYRIMTLGHRSTRVVAALKGAALRLARALLGAWLVVGPFVGVYARETDALIVVLVLLAAAYGFVAGRCSSAGAACLKPILRDGVTLLAVVWIAGASGSLLGALRLHEYRWLFAALLLAGFWLAEFIRVSKHAARA